MAQNKKSFILYTDLIHTVEQLNEEQAGRLFKHILGYVNDLNPQTDDVITKIAFEPIKQQLKRDLQKWDSYIEKQSLNGKKGGRPKKPKESEKTQAFSEKPKKADSVNVSDSVNVNVINKRDKSLLVERDEIFDQVWKAYSQVSTRQPGSKKDAASKFKKLKQTELEKIRQHLPKYLKNHIAAQKTDYLPNFTTYLNQRRYEDEKLPYADSQNELDNWTL
ncbi:DUF6291 domain-containing protein [Gammaproteobacteria bacterium]|nr:DUF6291 domain-containing protein [Gammaproteobacteria bacterium]